MQKGSKAIAIPFDHDRKTLYSINHRRIYFTRMALAFDIFAITLFSCYDFSGNLITQEIEPTR